MTPTRVRALELAEGTRWTGRRRTLVRALRIRVGDIRGGERLLPFAQANETEAAGLAAGSGREMYGRAI